MTDEDPDPGLIISAADAVTAAKSIEGVVDAYVLTAHRGITVTAIVLGRDIEEVRAELERRFREDMPITWPYTLEVLEAEAKA